MTTEIGEPVRRRRPWAWEAVVYGVGVLFVILGAYVWFVRANTEGDFSLRLSQLWDSIGLLSLGIAFIATGLTLTILRVQNGEAARGDWEMRRRQDQHSEVLQGIDSIMKRMHARVEQTGETVERTGEGVEQLKQLLGSQIKAAQNATSSELGRIPFTTEADGFDGGEGPDMLDEVSLEGVREGDVSNLPLDTHALEENRLAERVETADGVFYPVGAVPVGVIADLVAAWEADDPESKRWMSKSKANWGVRQIVGAYRSYSPGALAKGRRNLSGSPWFVTFRTPDESLVTYYLSRHGKRKRGASQKRPVVKRLVGEGTDARWVALQEAAAQS